ncbi:hypothetical protein SPI_04876 [Niveomyces insectorum RCEF 264]|uniref:2EXR domain-containing protein n=1 Tax=Niveomyces insectorum RCEF 264 TaxID=1081102 RepID=A0A167UXV4_9HYPO|nr:hypothetical protein SPI_04876 [Niveomyces insectorum RCEF 264]
MELTGTALTLGLARAQLFLVASQLSKTSIKLHKTNEEPDSRINLTEAMKNVFDLLLQISRESPRMAYAASGLVRYIPPTAPTTSASTSPGIATSAANTTPTTFHRFLDLPSELRRMVWMAAAQPPPCAVYLIEFEPALAGREPAILYMDDGGLWTACSASHQVVQRAYLEQHAYWKSRRVTHWFSDQHPPGMQCCRLGEFNKRGYQFKERVRAFTGLLDMAFDAMEHALRTIAADRRKDVAVSGAANDVFWMEPDWKPSEDDMPMQAVGRLCAELRRKNLY